MTGEDASAAASVGRTPSTESIEIAVAAAAKLANSCRRVIEHQRLMCSSLYHKTALHPSSRLIANRAISGAITWTVTPRPLVGLLCSFVLRRYLRQLSEGIGRRRKGVPVTR